MNESILSWNVTNWVTVVLMAAVGFALFGFVAQLYHNRRAKSAQ